MAHTHAHVVDETCDQSDPLTVGLSAPDTQPNERVRINPHRALDTSHTIRLAPLSAGASLADVNR